MAATVSCRSTGGESSFRRPIAAESFTPLEIGGTARPAQSISDSSPRSLTFEEIAPGNLVFYAAKRGSSRGAVSVSANFSCADPVSRFLRAVGRSAHQGCSVSFPAETITERWQPCTIHIDRACQKGTLALATNAGPDADIRVSEPLARGDDRSKRPDIYLFVVDTARADRLQPFSKTLPIGRALTTLGVDSLVFTNTRAPSSWTRPSTATILSGVHPDHHRVHERRDVLPTSLPVLQEILGGNGYFTFALSANANILPVWGFARGFDEFNDIGAASWGSAKTDARTLMDRLIDELETNESRPGFYYVHMMDPHAPYQPSSMDLKAVQALPGVEATFPHPTWQFGRDQEIDQYEKYLGELVDVDAEIGRFVDYLRSANLYSNALIVVVSDHGEEFRDHGLIYHGTGLFEEVLRVPLLIKLPQSAQLTALVPDTVGLEDVTPTVLAALGISAPQDADGRSVIESVSKTVDERAPQLSPQTPGFRLADWIGKSQAPRFATLKLDRARVSAVVSEAWKLIEYHHVKSTLLYNLQKDPHEQNDLAGTEPIRLAEMQALLAARGARLGQGWHLLFCGGVSEASIELRLHNSPESIDWIDLDSDDRIGGLASDGSRDIRLSLALRAFEVEELGQLVTRTAPDDEQATFAANASGEPISLSSLSSQPFHYTLGTSEDLRGAMSLDLAAVVEQATITGHEWIECPLSETDLSGRAKIAAPDPYIRIWRIAGVETIAADAVSPEVAERLRRLGYMW